VREGQKFVVVWVVTDTKETFALQVNGSALNTLVYLDRSFKCENYAV